MDMNETFKQAVINELKDRLRIYKIIRYRCDDHEDIVKLCDFQIEILDSIIGV